ncbi:VOC family protein [Cellulomonas marina]|uniref:VOC domain-containing protein n=1 Tax=Cellulomonas marina TaxID=988821 RepID=A0A1I0ZUM5_9CELL|nr:VOC family protein [Cellulomonas marina]GIG30564.1 hypothetical protein Cma02nite_31640 [Cellulomonas marina]SFB29414.1 hypothetical protein SAMN05421867_1133 [Cellulomonas marina]
MTTPGGDAVAVVPRLVSVVLDTTDVRGLAEFYRVLLGLTYREGDEPPTDGRPDQDWLVLQGDGDVRLAFQQVDEQPRSTWPEPGVPQMLHLDTAVGSVADLLEVRRRALALGARELHDRSDDPEEPLFVLADPAGHPFCVFVA